MLILDDPASRVATYASGFGIPGTIPGMATFNFMLKLSLPAATSCRKSLEIVFHTRAVHSRLTRHPEIRAYAGVVIEAGDIDRIFLVRDIRRDQ